MKKSQILLLASRKGDDENILRRFQDALTGLEYNTFSVYDLNAGEHIYEVLESQINKSDIFIFLLAADFLVDDNLFPLANKIIKYVKASNKPKLILPIIIRPTHIPDEFREFNVLDLSNVSDFDKMVKITLDALGSFEGKKIAIVEKQELEKQKLRKSAAQYIDETITNLSAREKGLKKAANIWYVIGYVSILLGVIVGIYLAVFNEEKDISSWQPVIFLSIKGAIIIILLLSSSKYSFNLAKSYMNESLKNSYKIHAISYGKFYLQVFEDDYNTNDIKEVFQHWNMDQESSFHNQDSNSFDPKLIESISSILNKVKAK